jgi:hypothetical protein
VSKHHLILLLALGMLAYFSILNWTVFHDLGKIVADGRQRQGATRIADACRHRPPPPAVKRWIIAPIRWLRDQYWRGVR